MTTEIITIGSELLHGLVRNTNVNDIRILAEAGLRPRTTRAWATKPSSSRRRSDRRHRAEVVIGRRLGPTSDASRER